MSEDLHLSEEHVVTLPYPHSQMGLVRLVGKALTQPTLRRVQIAHGVVEFTWEQRTPQDRFTLDMGLENDELLSSCDVKDLYGSTPESSLVSRIVLALTQASVLGKVATHILVPDLAAFIAMLQEMYPRFPAQAILRQIPGTAPVYLGMLCIEHEFAADSEFIVVGQDWHVPVFFPNAVLIRSA